jgi:hypothetical protein
MLDDNNLFQHAAVTSSAYASMAAFTAAANMYNSFYPSANTNVDHPVNYFGCTGKSKNYLQQKKMIKMNFIILEMKRERLDPKISVKLEGIDLWKRFNSIGTEMIITKYVHSELILSFLFTYSIEMVVDYFPIFIFLFTHLIPI